MSNDPHLPPSAVALVAKSITVLSIFGSVASILGILYIYQTAPEKPNGWTLGLGFGVALILSAYAIAIPGNRMEQNVRSKLAGAAYYSPDANSDPTDAIFVQRGEFCCFEGTYSVAFPHPYAEPPEIEVSNPRVSVMSVTRFQAILRIAGDMMYDGKARWIATGKPMHRVTVPDANPSVGDT